MAVAPSAAAATAATVSPSLEQARVLARAHNLIPLSYSFIEDCETPVSAFLKLRALAAGEPAFLLESADQGQRVGRWSFIGFRPREVMRWSLADGGDPYALAAERVASFNQAPLSDAAAGAPRPGGPAADGTRSKRTQCPGGGWTRGGRASIPRWRGRFLRL
jgi:hypothetical protein